MRLCPRPLLKFVFSFQERSSYLRLHLCCFIPPVARDEQESDYIQPAALRLIPTGFLAGAELQSSSVEIPPDRFESGSFFDALMEK